MRLSVLIDHLHYLVEREAAPGKKKQTWKGPRWKKPSAHKERKEITLHAKALGLKRKDLHNAVKQGELAPLEKNQWKNLDNTWSFGISRKNHKKYAAEINRNTEVIDQGFKHGHKIPAPIVLHRPGQRPYLIAGNTRLSAAYVHGYKPTVLHIRLKKKQSTTPQK